MLVALGIFVEFILIMLLMGYFIIYARAKSRYISCAVLGDVDVAEYYAKKRDKYSAIWHGLGLAMRIGFLGIITLALWGEWYYAILGVLIGIFLSWTVFDRGINMIMGSDFWYVDSKNVNKLIGKAYWVLTEILISGIIMWAIMGQRFFE